MAGPEIHVDSLVKAHRLGRVRALDGVNLEVRPAEVVGLIGPNGAGKSTLIGCLMGLLRPDSGRVTIGGRPVDHEDVRSRTGWLPERPSFHSGLVAREQLGFHAALLGVGSADVDASLARVGLGPQAAVRSPSTYSQGMKQRLGLALALLGAPDLLILDEPTTALDPGGLRVVRRIIEECKASGATIVLSSHHLDEVARACDRVAVMNAGRICAIEPPADVERLERHFAEVTP